MRFAAHRKAFQQWLRRFRRHKGHWKAPLAKHEEVYFPGLRILKLQEFWNKGVDSNECQPKQSGVITQVFLPRYGTPTQVLVSSIFTVQLNDTWCTDTKDNYTIYLHTSILSARQASHICSEGKESLLIHSKEKVSYSLIFHIIYNTFNLRVPTFPLFPFVVFLLFLFVHEQGAVSLPKFLLPPQHS